MGKEFRLHGPPGTGKTRRLAEKIVPELADKYGPDKIMLTSFTKAAAQELASRIDLGDSKIIGTLHSICFHALGCPSLTEDKLKDWNTANSTYALNKDSKDPGPICYSQYQILRNKMIPKDDWPSDVKKFAKNWEAWKAKIHSFDFMDLIEMAGESYSPPGSPAAIVIDEAQDFTKLEMSTLRRWATQVREFWVVGDDDQTIFNFSGASAENMLYPPLPPEQKIFLEQSYRIPRQVHKLADKLIRKVKVREPKSYKPRDEEGRVIFSEGTIDTPEWVIKKAVSLPGESMILTSCNYMLTKIVKHLRDEGIAFSNPWRPEDTGWNPLSTKGTDLLKDFLDEGEDHPYWDTSQFLSWAEHIKIGPEGLIRKQGKAGIKQLRAILEENPDTPGLHTCRDYISDILSPNALDCAMERDVAWLTANLSKAKSTVLQYPSRILRKHGRDELFKKPKIFVGTIHSVKGAGADNVFIYPDISYASAQEAETQEGLDNLRRLFYVGITRAKQNLYIMSKGTRHSFSI